jgi:hypothetical protein
MNEHFNRTMTPGRGMSPQDFALWGVEDVAYIKHVVAKDGEGWAIHRADGSQIGFAPGRDVAFAAVRQYDLDPVSVH